MMTHLARSPGLRTTLALLLAATSSTLLATPSSAVGEEKVLGNLVRAAYQQRGLAVIVDDVDDLRLRGLVELFKNDDDDQLGLLSLVQAAGTNASIVADVALLLASLSPSPKRGWKDRLGTILDQITALRGPGGRRLRVVLSFQEGPAVKTEENLLEVQAAHFDKVELSAVYWNDTACEGWPCATLKEYNHRGSTFVVRCSSSFLAGCSQAPIAGSTITVAYDEWFPVFYLRDKGRFEGLFHDVMMIVASRLGLVVEFVKNRDPGVWGQLDKNGSWQGLLGMIHRGEADLTASGTGATPDRAEYFDFSAAIMYMKTSLFTRRSGGARVSLQNYFWEFDRYTWACIGVTSFFLFVGLFLALRTISLPDSSAKACSVVLRSLLYKETAVPTSTFSLKILLLVIFGLSTALTVSYRGCLNSFLAVVQPVVRIKSFDDVLEQTTGLALWPGGVLEQDLENSRPNSPEKKLYDQWQKDDPAKISSYEYGLEQVTKKDYVLIGEEESIRVLPEFTCNIVLVDSFHFKIVSLAIPFLPGSRLSTAFSTEILRLQTQGIVDRLYFWYFTQRMRKESDCLDGQVSGLGLANTFTPFACIAVGIVAGASVLLLEWCGSCWASKVDSRRTPDDDQITRRREVSRIKLADAKSVVCSQELSDSYKLALLEDLFGKQS